MDRPEATRVLLTQYTTPHREVHSIVARVVRDVYHRHLAGLSEPTTTTVAIFEYGGMEAIFLQGGLKDHFHLKALSQCLRKGGEDNCLYFVDKEGDRVELKLRIDDHRRIPFTHKIVFHVHSVLTCDKRLRETPLRGVSADLWYFVVRHKAAGMRGLSRMEHKLIAPAREVGPTAIVLLQEMLCDVPIHEFHR
jgi:hypothetical protein